MTTLVQIGFAVLLALLILFLFRRSSRPSKKDQELADRLMATGAKARATVTSVRPTGAVAGNENVGVEIGFWLEPLDGSPQFEASKKLPLLERQFPRLGDVWPAWYDPSETGVIAVAARTELSPDQIPTYREFGIDHPLDRGE